MSLLRTPPKVVFSNQVEVLYQHLKHDLFAGTHPFSRRMLIVPSPAVKSWLMLQMAQDPDLGIAAGIEVCFVDPAMHRLVQLLGLDQSLSEKRHCFEPSELELSLALEQEIWRVVHIFFQLSANERALWDPLLTYLSVHGTSPQIARKCAKRITALSAKLARYFVDYGCFGGKIISAWNLCAPADWQQALWQSMESQFCEWNYPYRKLGAWTANHLLEAVEWQVHAFGLSYLAPVHHRFLMKAAQYIPVNYYQISPCQKFWTDLLSERESVKLRAYWQKRNVEKSQQNDLDAYLRDNNPLLANYGRLGREMSCQLEESHLISLEQYALPASVLDCESYAELLDDEPLLYESGHPLSLLEAVQTDVALLRNPEDTPPINFVTYDRTIQVHAAPKPMREVEAIYNAIMAILDSHQHDETPILAGDVIVMAPNIEAYAPFIRSVFGASDSVLDYQVMDLQMPAQNLFVQGFMHLLQLPLSRWDAASLIRLFEYPAFQSRQQLTGEDVQVLRQWIKAAGIRWGNDHKHRNALLQRDHCSKQIMDNYGEGTWDYGLGRLLEGLAMSFPSNPNEWLQTDYLPLESAEVTQGQLLGKIIHLLRSLSEDLRPLSDETKLTPKEWSLYLQCLCETYFSSVASEDDETGRQELMHHIEAFAGLSKVDKDVFAFHSIQCHLEQALNKKTVNHREGHMHAVRFCSLLPMRAIPAKVLVLMGLDEGAFPRKDEQAKLNYLHRHPEADYYPTQIDFDRYLFLEALLSARRYFLLSYISTAQGDAKEQAPSLLVTELLAYFDKAYRLPDMPMSQKCLVHHTLFPFDQRYFSEDYAHRSYLPSHYSAAQSHYAKDKLLQYQFISTFNSADIAHEEQAKEITVELSELAAFARNPLKTYFNKALGIYLEKEEDRTIQCEEELHLSRLDAALISREGLFSNVSEALMRAEKLGKLPAGPFKEIGADKIRKEVEILKANLQMHGTDARQVFAIEFSERFRAPICAGPCWQMPALSLITPKGVEVKLIGRLETVSAQGLITFGEDILKDTIKLWPTLLVFCFLIDKYQLPIASTLLFIKGTAGKAKSALFKDTQELLGRYLDYFFHAKRYASPLLPEWVAPLLEGDQHELQANMRKSSDDAFQPIYDDYLKWMGRNAPQVDAASALEHWQGTARDLFVDMSAAWYPKLHKASRGAEDEIL